MKSGMRITILSVLFLFCAAAWAADNSIQFVPDFAGSLNASQINACEEKYKNLCPIIGAKTAIDGIAQQWSCIGKKMAADKSCVQASKIREITAYSPTKIKQYGKISVFYVTALADGVDSYYMVDTKGQLIQLTNKLNDGRNQQYLRLKQKYPDIALTSFLYWTKVGEDLFPRQQILKNKTQQLIFRQDLRNGVCVACERLGYATIAYEFDPQGVFLGSKLLQIVATS